MTSRMEKKYGLKELGNLSVQLQETLARQTESSLSSRVLQTILNEFTEVLSRIEDGEREWQKAFDAVQDPVFLHDKNYRIIRANKAYAEKAGLNIRDVIGMTYWEVFPKRDGPLPNCASLLEMDQHSSENEEVRLDSGETYLSRSFAVRDAQNSYLYSVHIMEDITEQRRLQLALEESAARYQSLFEDAPDAVFLADAETGYLLDANPAAERLTGRTRNELLSLHQSQLHPPNSPAVEVFREHVQAESTSALFLPSEIPVLHADGHEIPVEISARVFHLNGRRVIQGVFRDISLRKVIEAKLHYNAQILAQVHDAVMVTDMDGTITSWNQGAERVFGYREREALGQPITFVYPEEEHAFLTEQVIAPLKAKGSHEVEVRMRRHNGEVFFAQLSLSLLHNEQGTPIGMIGYALDISQRKLVEQALHDSEETFRTIANTAQDAVLLLDDVGKIVYWNPAATRIFGYEDREVIGQNAHDLLAPSRYRSAHEHAWPHFQQTGEGPVIGNVLELAALHRDGTEFPVELSISAVCIRQSWHAVGILRDITERKQAEATLLDTSSKLSLSHNLLKSIIESIPVRVFWKDRELRYLGCNTLFANDAGLSRPDDIIGKTDFDMGWKDQAEIYRADDQHIIDSGKAKLGYEEPQTTPDGQTIWLRTSKVPLHDDSQTVIGVLGIYDDITQQKQAEQNLLLSESRLKEAQQVAHLGSWEMDLVKNELWWSDENHRIFGIEPGERNTYETFIGAVHPEDREFVNKAYTESVRNKTPYDIEHRLLMTDGEVKWVHERCKTHYADDGTPLRSAGTTLDITKRKLAEAQAERFGRILNSSINEIYVFAADSLKFELVNEGAQHNLGYSMAELRDMTPLDIKPEFSAEKFAQLVAPLRLDGNRLEVFETVHQRKDGSQYPVEVHLQYSSRDIRPVFVATILDITARRKADKHLRHVQFNLAEAQRIAHLGNWYLDITNNKLEWSDEIYRIFELDPQQFGATYEAFLTAIHPDDRDRVDSAYTNSLKDRLPYDITHRLLMKDGRIKYVREVCETKYSEDGQALHSLGTVQDVTEQYLLNQDLSHSNRALKAISSCNSTLIHSTNENDLFSNMCRVIVDEGGYRFVWIGLVQADKEKHVQPIAHAGFEDGYLENINVTYAENKRGRGPVGCAVRHGQLQVVHDSLTDPHFAPWREAAASRGYRSVLSLPLKNSNNEVFAVLSIYAAETNAFDDKALELMQELANDIAFGVQTLRTRGERDHYLQEHQKSDERYKKMLGDTIRAMSLTVEKRDPYTAGHQNKVAQLSVAIGRELGMDEDRLEGLRLGATIHDIGKIYVPAEILNRPGRLSKAEFEIIKSHAEVGYDIIKDVHFPWPVADMVGQHHERMDGSGYPHGLKGDEIILEARILAVADVAEAITSHRPYRPAKGMDIAIKEIEANRGRLYDSEVVDTCLRLIRDSGFVFEEPAKT